MTDAPTPPPPPPSPPAAPRAPGEGAAAPPGVRRAAWVAFALFSAVFGTLSILRFETFHSRSLDMAYYVRLVWGLAHGDLDQPVVNAPHVLGLHLEPVLLPLALLGRLGAPIPELLLVVQALAAGAALFPALALARRHLAAHAGERLAFAAALAIYLLPTVTRCVDYDFHPATMALWPLMAFVEALDAGRWRRAVAWFAAALACREDVGLQAGLVAVTWLAAPARPGDRPRAAALAAFGFAWFFVYALAVQPRFLAETGSFNLHFGRFGGGRGGVGGVLEAALADPAALVAYLLSGDRLLYPVALLAQVAFLPVLAPRFLAGALPLVAINLLSDFPNIRGIHTHYITAAAPFFVGAGIAGAARLAARLGNRRPAPRVASGALVAAAALAYLLRGTSPLSPEWRLQSYLPDDTYVPYRAIVATTPPDAEVAANVRLLAHLAERKVARMGSETGPPVIRPAGARR
jgi:uncharacterized membrane protein